MPVAVSTDALTTLEACRVHLKRPQTWNQDEQDRVQRLINAYSRQIRLYTGRQFVPAESAVTKKFRYEGSGMISLSPFELNGAPTTITLGTDLPTSSWQVLPAQDANTESQYRLEPRQGTLEGTYLWLSLPEIGMYSPLAPETLVSRRARGHEISILGNWGMGQLPADVELACMIAVSNGYLNPSAMQSVSVGGMSLSEVVESGGQSEGIALPRDARSLLAQYKRTAYSVSG